MIEFNMTMSEQVLSVIPGATEHQRLVIVHRRMDVRGSLHLFQADPTDAAESVASTGGGVSMQFTQRPFCEQIQSFRDRPIVLRQESFSPAVGWFTQSELDLTMQQWAIMRTTMVPAESGNAAGTSTNNRVKVRAGRPVTSIVSQRMLTSDGELVSFAIDRDEAVSA